MNLVFIINSLALGVGLAMDAFSVSIANGLHEPCMAKRRMCLMAGVYALFQYAMPMIGWICVHTIVETFSVFEKFVPWIALLLLCYIGGKMVLEGVHDMRNPEEEDACAVGSARLSGKELAVQGIATSIDALSVGFTIAEYDIYAANTAAWLIAAVTFVICFCGLVIGKKAAGYLKSRATIAGGCLLIGIGIEIFVKAML